MFVGSGHYVLNVFQKKMEIIKNTTVSKRSEILVGILYFIHKFKWMKEVSLIFG